MCFLMRGKDSKGCRSFIGKSFYFWFMIFTNAISWFEIPTKDITRAQAFYEAIFDMKMMPMDMGSLKMRIFPLENPMNIGGALVHNEEFYKPSSTDGPM